MASLINKMKRRGSKSDSKPKRDRKKDGGEEVTVQRPNGREMPRDDDNLPRAKKFIRKYTKQLEESVAKYDRLKNLDMFVLDNSIRESTVGQLRGHTLESKRAIYEEVKKCGFKNIVVASFSHMTRVDDLWIKELAEKEPENVPGMFAFSELTFGIKNKLPDKETVPVGLQKMEAAGLYNVIFEIDLGDATYNFEQFTVDDLCELLLKWIKYTHTNLHKDAKVLVSFRDIAEFMPEHADRLFQVVDFLCGLPPDLRLFGLMYEEPGKSYPEECGSWSRFIRDMMDAHNWDGHLLVHIHEKWGYCDATALHCLIDGADGVWASICIEGASMGQAASCVTLMNMVRMGNKKVLQRYNCQYLRKAAINVTKITTGRDPDIKQPLFGARALDFWLTLEKDEFDLADFFGEEAPMRISTLSPPEMIRQRLIQLFGEDEQFTVERATRMKEVMLEDLRSGRKEEYMSRTGVALLFDRSGGKLTEDMREEIATTEVNAPHHKYLIGEVRKKWDEFDILEKEVGDNLLQYDSFYNAFMAPYFSCYRCNDTKKGLCALDMDADGSVDWSEFMVYLKWALNQYPKTQTMEELLEITFRKGLIPAMRDEVKAKGM